VAAGGVPAKVPLDRLHLCYDVLKGRRLPLAQLEELREEMRWEALQVIGDGKPTGKSGHKKSTASGEAEEKLIGALALHHRYENGWCDNQEPIGVRALARKAKVSEGSGTGFFKAHFEGHNAYKVTCTRDPRKLADKIGELVGDISPQKHLSLIGEVPDPGDDG
jgi:hypothetical protein